MSRAEDPERLVAEALRAQAASAPVPRPPSMQEGGAPSDGAAARPEGGWAEGDATGTAGPGQPAVSFSPGYGLISGSDVDGPPDPLVAGPAGASGGWAFRASGGLPAAGDATGGFLAADDTKGERTAEVAEPLGGANGQLTAAWVLALAVLLGLAAGAVAGLLTLL